MTITRRSFVLLSLCASAQRVLGQGVASREARAQPKPAPSGRPFHAHFTDIAKAAGLRAPTIYGGVESKKYILEANGCGCAFIDYDNDGWMDIFLLSGTRLEGAPPEATNRLYKNNRDGTFTDVTEKAGLRAVGWANGVCVGDYNNDGFDDIFCTYFGQNRLYRNNGDESFTDVTKEAGLLEEAERAGEPDALSWTTIATAISIFSSRTISASPSTTLLFRGKLRHATGRAFPSIAGRGAFPPAGTLCIATTATAPSPT